MKLHLLFTKDGLQYQISKNKSILEEKTFLYNEEKVSNYLALNLEDVLAKDPFKEIAIVSAINHFTLTPEGFSAHEMGTDLISFNAPVVPDEEELMLAINKKYGVQFYYTFPLEYYKKIKAYGKPTHFNFSGEQFLSKIQTKTGKEIHINLYHNQCEFFALENQKVILYNNLDVNSEVDFLYFVMFTLSKINFGLKETGFFVYGETVENETFISELEKFVTHLKIVYKNAPKKNFILS